MSRGALLAVLLVLLVLVLGLTAWRQHGKALSDVRPLATITFGEVCWMWLESTMSAQYSASAGLGFGGTAVDRPRQPK